MNMPEGRRQPAKANVGRIHTMKAALPKNQHLIFAKSFWQFHVVPRYFVFFEVLSLNASASIAVSGLLRRCLTTFEKSKQFDNRIFTSFGV